MASQLPDGSLRSLDSRLALPHINGQYLCRRNTDVRTPVGSGSPARSAGAGDCAADQPDGRGDSPSSRMARSTRRAVLRLWGCGRPCEMTVDSSATRGLLSRRACWMRGETNNDDTKVNIAHLMIQTGICRFLGLSLYPYRTAAS